MRYKVPQDVQREDQIIGPLTLKQMIILGAGGGVAYAIYVSLAQTYYIEVWLPPVAIVVGITLAFAFLKIHDLTFSRFIMSFTEYHLLPKKRYWIQGQSPPLIFPLDIKEKKQKKEPPKEQKQQKSIEELTKVLDTHGGSEPEKKETDQELSRQEKKEKLHEIINQNYQNK